LRRKQEHQDEEARKINPHFKAGSHTPLTGKQNDKEDQAEDEEADDED